MEPIEITAKSPDEGRKLAAEKLGVSPEEVEVTVLEETKGLFGRMSYRLSATTSAAPAAAEASTEEDAPAKPKATRSRAKKAVDDAPAEVKAETKPRTPRSAAAKEEPRSEAKTVETAATPAPTRYWSTGVGGGSMAAATTPHATGATGTTVASVAAATHGLVRRAATVGRACG